MRILAQHGPKGGERITRGLQENLIDGAIYGARDIKPERLRERLEEQQTNFPASERLLDPQFYASLLAAEPGVRLGYLDGDEGHSYFQARRRRELERQDVVIADLETCLEYQRGLPVSGFIAPNIVVRRSLDSVEATISKDFLRNAASVHARMGDPRPLYATLAISTDALQDRIELQNFLQEITELDNPPTGFYVLMAHPDSDIPPTLEELGVLSRWMLINRALSLNGFNVINGYADLISPFLGAAGASTTASGWFNTLKVFSLGKFLPSLGMARQPVPRYSSTRLMKSIRHTELEQLRVSFPEVLNGRSTDAYYDDEEGSRPEPIGEALQNWDCLRELGELVVPGDPIASINALRAALEQADETYADIGATGIALRERSNSEHIQLLREELTAFEQLAEI